MENFIKIFASNLSKWVEAQKEYLKSVEKIEKQMDEADRLELILATRAAFKHMIKTIEAFDKWLQDPFIVGHMPREMLVEVQKSVWEIMKHLLELDIKHTSEFRDHLVKLAEEGKLNPIFYSKEKSSSEDRFSMSV
ncbi:MAG: DUF2153 domain-containing protein [Thermoprotei archaeon]|nr:MAG: DUF2153 domain-containing protein [Thermoprotei archaeon]